MAPIIRSVLLASLLAASLASAQGPGNIPKADEVKALLAKEPITEASWPAWKERLVDWFGDASPATDPAYRAANQFALNLADGNGELPARFNNDHLAWYFLG